MTSRVLELETHRPTCRIQRGNEVVESFQTGGTFIWNTDVPEGARSSGPEWRRSVADQGRFFSQARILSSRLSTPTSILCRAQLSSFSKDVSTLGCRCMPTAAEDLRCSGQLHASLGARGGRVRGNVLDYV